MKQDKHDSLTQRAYDKIKRMILSGELKQGQVISTNAMAETLNISRTPVNNACQRLEFEKLLTILPKQGVLINTISLEIACGIYELRAAIEAYNAKRVLDKLTEKDIKILEESLEKQKKYCKEANSLMFMDEDIFFHRYILEKSVNYELLSVINQLYDRAYILGTKNSSLARMEQSVIEHEKILSSIEQKDKQAFANAIEENILNGFRSLAGRYLGE
ncbi:MAG: GntR family transcriptional regulator [Ruminococcaceae bacterium]|nr:GntR family transcriptional regulator [Oscillospiraceae bacterium]